MQTTTTTPMDWIPAAQAKALLSARVKMTQSKWLLMTDALDKDGKPCIPFIVLPGTTQRLYSRAALEGLL